MIDKADFKVGFWVAAGVIFALFVWSLLFGGIAKLRRG